MPTTRDVGYEFDTAMVKQYLQNRFNATVKAAKAANANALQVEDVEIDLLTFFIEDKYPPFLLVMPTSVLDKPEVDEDTPSIFMVDHSDGAKFKRIYYELIKRFMFSKDDRNAFRSSSWRREVGLRNYNSSNILSRYATAKIVGPDGEDVNDNKWIWDTNNEYKVLLWLDPIRVFHWMLVDQNNRNQEFYVNVNNVVKTNETNARYDVRRVVASKRKGKKNGGIENIIKKYITR